jgi:hypothetical protein
LSFFQLSLDRTSLVALRLQSLAVFVNLEFFRKLYPECGTGDNSKVKNRLHHMWLPNDSDQTFEEKITNPKGSHPALDTGVRQAYLDRADVLLSLGRFREAKLDYSRSRVLPEGREDDKWRMPLRLKGMAVDIQTMDIGEPTTVSVWIKPPVESGSDTTFSRPGSLWTAEGTR